MIRLFQADGPHYVAVACMVAGLEEDHEDVLLLSSDQTAADREPYLCDMRAMAGAHPWRAIADISGLPLNEHWQDHLHAGSRLAVVRAQVRSAEFLRERVRTALRTARPGAELHDVGEVVVPCIHQPDVQLLCTLFAGASVSLMAHSFASLYTYEIERYGPCVIGTGPSNDARRAVTRRVKRLIWGRDAALPGRFPLRTVYTFGERPDWGTPVVDLAPRRTPAEMRRIFGGLPEEVRGYFDRLAAAAGPGTVVLLPPPVERVGDRADDFVLSELASLAKDMLAALGSSSVLLKPHPASADPWVRAMTQRLAQELPGARITVVQEHRFLPVEVVLQGFAVAGAGGVSSALGLLHAIYGWPTYGRDALLRGLYAGDETSLRKVEVEIGAGDYVLI